MFQKETCLPVYDREKVIVRRDWQVVLNESKLLHHKDHRHVYRATVVGYVITGNS